MRLTRKNFIHTVFPVVAILLLPLLFQEVMFWFRIALDAEPLRAAITTHLPSFLEDERLLADEPLFKPTKAKANAKSYLHPRLDWTTPGTVSDDRQITGSVKIQLNESLRAKLKAWGPKFPRYHSSISYNTVDFWWLSELKHFDHWDLMDGVPLDNVFYLKQLVALHLTQPYVKQFEDFVLWSKLRLMKGLHEGTLELATSETRHLAQLLYSTETLMGTMTAIAILRAEVHVSDYLNANLQARGDWEPFDRDQLDGARRAALGYNALFTIFTPEDVLKQTFQNKNVSVGRCSGLAKGMLRTLLVRRLLEPRVRGERNYASQFNALDEAYEAGKSGCRLTGIKMLWEKKESRTTWLALYEKGTWDWIHVRWIQHVPYLRQAWGIDLASMYLSNGFQTYPTN